MSVAWLPGCSEVPQPVQPALITGADPRADAACEADVGAKRRMSGGQPVGSQDRACAAAQSSLYPNG